MNELTPAGAYAASAKESREPDLVERLEMELKNLTDRAADVKAAIDAIHSSPDIERILKLVTKVSYRL